MISDFNKKKEKAFDKLHPAQAIQLNFCILQLDVCMGAQVLMCVPFELIVHVLSVHCRHLSVGGGCRKVIPCLHQMQLSSNFSCPSDSVQAPTPALSNL